MPDTADENPDSPADKSANAKDRIVHSTARLLRTREPLSIRLQDIAERAKVSRSLIVAHFGGVESVIIEGCVANLPDIIGRLLTRIESAKLHPPEQRRQRVVSALTALAPWEIACMTYITRFNRPSHIEATRTAGISVCAAIIAMLGSAPGRIRDYELCADIAMTYYAHVLQLAAIGSIASGEVHGRLDGLLDTLGVG